MQEQPPTPNQDPTHSIAQKGGAIALTGALLLGSNMPGVAHHAESVTSQVSTVEQVVDEVPVDLLGNPAETTVVLTPDVNNQYRVDFKTTETDGQSSESQVTTELDKVLSPTDWAKVYDISVRGESSAEDEQHGGGLQAQSEVNTNLALQRALIAASPVADAFKAKGIDVQQAVEKQPGQPAEKMMQVQGVEDSWSDADMQKAANFAEQFGYTGVEDMVVHHNDGGTPPAVNEFLKPLLEDHRGAAITLKLRGDDGKDKVVMVSVVHDKVTVKDVTHDVNTTEIVNNQTVGNIPEQIPAHEIVTPPTSTPRPWEHTRKDAQYRTGMTAPRGNGAKPLRHGGGVPFNPTPSNFN